MAKTPSRMVELGTQAPDFNLPDTDGKKVSLKDFEDKEGLLVMFICNHCPFVIHIRNALATFANEYENRIGIIAVNSNDVENYPDDSPSKMKDEKELVGYSFPYLFDESQEVAKTYDAACTPDFFLFDRDRKLIYRGQFDSSRPSNDIPVTGKDLRAACDAYLKGSAIPEEQIPSIGCNIKWKEGNAPSWFG